MNTLFIYFLRIQQPYLAGLCAFAFTNHEREGELMVRSLYKIGALTVITV